MLRFIFRMRGAVFFRSALGIALALAGCGGQSQSLEERADSAVDGSIDEAASGSGGGGGGFVIGDGAGGAGGVPQCEWPVKEQPDAATGWLQTWCDGAGMNALECPAQSPTPGSPCPSIGITCVYGTGPSFAVSKCDGLWKSKAHVCAEECGTLDGGVGIDLSAATCGSKGGSPCTAGTEMTDAERLHATLSEISKCCGSVNEGTIRVTFEGGCATAVFPEKTPGQVSECFAAILAGRQLACAMGLHCGSISWSTLK